VCKDVRSSSGACTAQCTQNEIKKSVTEGYADANEPKSKNVCVKCENDFAFETPDGVCEPCDTQCRAGCTGKGPKNCIDSTEGKCKNYKYTHPNPVRDECVQDCRQYPRTFPFGVSADSKDKVCRPCHSECRGNKCTGEGPQNCLNGECANQKLPQSAGQFGGRCVSDCGKWGEPEWGNFYNARNDVTCGTCDRQCLGCSGPLATDCTAEQCVNVYDESKGCVIACPTNEYVKVVDANPSSYKVCQKCDASCDQSKGCTGGSSADCNQCQEFTIPVAAGGVPAGCVSQCPAGWFAGENKVCQRCYSGCRFSCSGEGADQCTLPDNMPEYGQVKLTTVAQLIGADGITVNGAFNDVMRRALARVIGRRSDTIALASATAGTADGEAGTLKVTYRVTVPEAEAAKVGKALETAIPLDECPDTTKCLITELRHYNTDFEPVTIYRRDAVREQAHSTKCATGFVELDGTCKRSCGEGYFQQPDSKCGKCANCVYCSGPASGDCLGECLVKSDDGSCAQACTIDQFLSGVEKICQPCNSECAKGSGCTGPNANECRVCANYEFGGTCLPICPGVTIRGACVASCSNFLTLAGECIEACPDNTVADAERICQACSDQCFETCSAPGDPAKCTASAFDEGGQTYGRKCAGALATALGGSTQTCQALCKAGDFFRNQGKLPQLSAKGGYECLPCETGFRCQDGEVQEPCPLTTFTDKRGQVECIECPQHATCEFNWQKGARDMFYCDAGYRKPDAQAVAAGQFPAATCILASSREESTSTEDDKDSLIMIGVVAGCIALLSIVTAMFCVVSNRQSQQSIALHPNYQKS